MAGRDEMYNRTIYSGSTSAHYAIVHLDELAGEGDGDSPKQDQRLDELQIIGSTATVEETRAQRAVERGWPQGRESGCGRHVRVAVGAG